MQDIFEVRGWMNVVRVGLSAELALAAVAVVRAPRMMCAFEHP